MQGVGKEQLAEGEKGTVGLLLNSHAVHESLLYYTVEMYLVPQVW